MEVLIYLHFLCTKNQAQGHLPSINIAVTSITNTSQLNTDEIRVLPQYRSYFLISYKDEPSIRMRGTPYIRPETGNFAINALLHRSKAYPQGSD